MLRKVTGAEIWTFWRSIADSKPERRRVLLLFMFPEDLALRTMSCTYFLADEDAATFDTILIKLATPLPHRHLQVISLDVMIDSEWGDITKASTREFWLRAVRERYVVAALGGPPCETWSKAKEHNLAGASFAPRVLRTPELPWGKPSLRLRELWQLRIGNALMGFMLELVIALFCVHGVAMTEHPAPPASEGSVTIWRTPLMELLLSLPGIELVQLAQGLWGAKSPKSWFTSSQCPYSAACVA